MTLRLFSILLLGCTVTVLGPKASAQDGVVQETAEQIRPHLDAPSRLAATAVLIHERTGEFPRSATALLGDPDAMATGIRRVRLAELGVSVSADTLRMVYLLTPTQEEPSERGGALAVHFSEGEYAVDFRLAHRDDPDFDDDALPVARNQQLRVRRAQGSFCVDPDFLRARARDGSLNASFPFLDEARPLTVAFWNTRSGDSEGTALLLPPSE